jgi:glycosyltransferase involved in cell wall biosynthesis
MMGVKKIITHDHTPGVRTPPSAIKLFVKRLLHKATWASADACFAVSPFVARRLVDVNGVDAKRVFCITNGIRVDSLPVEKNIHTGIRIVTVARANYYKGIDFAIKVIASLVVRAPEIDFTYTLYGDGPHIDEFKLLATNLNVSDRIIFAGRVSDVSDKLLSADIAFHPSLGEAMSLALLEYMRAQLPLVVSSNPSVSSFLTKNVNALIYDERDISSATEVLLTLINSAELRTNLGRNAWLSVKEEFNETQMFGALEKSIAQIIN